MASSGVAQADSSAIATKNTTTQTRFDVRFIRSNSRFLNGGFGSQADSLQQFNRVSAKQTIPDVARVTAETSVRGQYQSLTGT
jgi:hypothetical protein